MKTALATGLAIALTLPAARGDAAGSKAIDDAMLGELETELKRGVESLSVPDEPAPYFISFKLTEVEVNDVASSLGAAMAKRERHFMNLDANVHVGDYEFDNSNFVFPRQELIDGLASITLPLEATPKIARKAAWLATDAAFQEALAQYTAKKANRQRQATTGATVPSYSKEPPLVKMDPVKVPALEDNDTLEKAANDVSAVFRDIDSVRESHVAYTSFLERRWYLNTEGTRAHDVRRVSGVIIVATARAEDGELLSVYASHYGKTMADLPDVDALKKQARELGKLLDEMRTAPPIGNYTGPVLFEGEGAPAITRLTLAPQLSGTPVPDGVDAAQYLGGEFTERIGLRVVSPLLSVYDDPTATKAGKQPLIGGFRFDDEGVAPRRVDVIKNGKLETLLMSRTPSAQLKQSNGHARRTGTGTLHGSTTNLFVSSNKGKSRAALRKALVAEAKSQGLDYAIVIQQLDDPVITANGEVASRELYDELQSRQKLDMPQTNVAYRLYTNGKLELIRGVQLRNVPVRAWRDVTGVGKAPEVTNYLATTDDGVLLRLRGGGDGFVPSAGIESATVAPDLLFRELDIQRTPSSLIPPPTVPKP